MADQNNEGTSVMDVARDLLSFDPFPSDGDGNVKASTPPAEKSGQEGGQQQAGGDQKGGDTKTTPKTDQQQSGQQPPGKPAASATPTVQPPAAGTQPPQPATTTPSVEQLQGQVTATRQALDSLLSAVQTGQQGGQSGTPAADKPRYQFQIPPQIAQAIRSEDPQESMQGMGALVNGMANAMFKDIQSHVQEQITAVQQTVEQIVQGQLHSYMIKQDFFSSYPTLNRPELSPLIASAATAVTQEWAATGKQLSWTPEFKQAMYDKLVGMLGGIAPQGQPTLQPQVPQPPAQQQRPFQGGGSPARAGAGGNPPPDPNNGQAMLDSIGLAI